MGVCNVYASCVEAERKLLWDEIVNAMSSFSIPWILGGDFNSVLDESERKGVCDCRGSIRSFRDFLSRALVVDLPLHGLTFTWTNSREEAA